MAIKDDIRPIRIQRTLFENMAITTALVMEKAEEVKVHWGEPDEEGFYTPRIQVTHSNTQLRDERAIVLMVFGLLVLGAILFTLGRITA